MNIIYVTGTAGSGKSLLTSSLVSWYREKSQDAIAVNLDPGVLSLPYDPDVDIRNSIDFQQIMVDYSLGPNGALIFANDLIASKLATIQEEMESTNADFAIVDTPGQIELFAFRDSGPYIAKGLQGESKALLFLMDAVVASTPASFLSLLLLSISVQLRMEMPQLNVLSKVDLAKESAREIVKWSRDPFAFEDALSKVRSGDDYTFYTELFRGLRRSSLSSGVYPVSSYTRDGFIALVGEFSRMFRGGEEYEEG
ncbi:MAG: ATP/GTP-binding protein [Thaumarchaeota archaeon]|nr:ATP/GTP-binding protein [Nitrososphaerota archaeon]